MKRERAKDGRQTPDFIIATARDLFMQLGYRAVSTRQIADACGITQPALYHHFRNKKEIYVEVIRTVLVETENSLLEIVTKEYTIYEKMLHVFRYFLHNHQYDLSLMFHDVSHEFDDETQQKIHGWWMKSFLQPVVQMIQTATLRGEIRDLQELNTNETEMAFILLNFIKSAIDPVVMNRLPAEKRASEIDRTSAIYVEMILTGLTK